MAINIKGIESVCDDIIISISGILAILTFIQIVGNSVPFYRQCNAIIFVLFEKNVDIKMLNRMRIDRQ